MTVVYTGNIVILLPFIPTVFIEYDKNAQNPPLLHFRNISGDLSSDTSGFTSKPPDTKRHGRFLEFIFFSLGAFS